MYFRFEPPIRVSEIEAADEDARARIVRDRTKAAVESALETLFARRDHDEAMKR
jgi:hypothetical protein